MDNISPLRIARIKKGLTQADLGFAIGVTKASVSGWETDRETPDVRKLARVVRALRPHLNISAYLSHVEAVEKARAA